MSTHVVATTDEISEGERKLIQVKGREVAIFNHNGDFHAYLNWCTHQSGPACEGPLSGTRGAEFDAESLEVTFSWEREDEILNCPWHGWEFDITSGKCLSRRNCDLLKYPVSIEDKEISITI